MMIGVIHIRRFEYIIIIMMLVTISIASASTPDFTVTENMGQGDNDDELVNGRNEVGELVITTAPFISDIYNQSTFTTRVLQQHDRIIWRGNQSIIMKNPFNAEVVIPPNGQYYFGMTGAHVFTSITNTSQSSTITVIAPDINNIHVRPHNLPSGFNMTFDPNAFVLLDEQVVDVEVIVDDDVAPGTYDLNYTVGNKEFTEEFKVVVNKEWSVDDDEMNYSVVAKSGDNIYLGYFLLENVGNDDVEISVLKEGNASTILGTPQPQTLYKKQTLRVDVQLQIPTTQKVGVYESTITIIGGVNTTEHNFTISVEDSILPSIKSINFSTDKAQVENIVTVIAEDNDDVTNVTMTYSGKTVFMKKDNQVFTHTEIFPETKTYEIEFCAIDASKNRVCESVNETFTKRSVIVGFKPKVELPSKKIGKYSTITLFNLTERIDEGIVIRLIDFVSLSSSNARNDTRTLRIIDGDGSIERFTLASDTVKVYEKGEIKLEIRSEEANDFTGTLGIETPVFIEEVPDVVFEVSFKDYDVPEDFTKTWLGDRQLVCEVVDTGNLDSSYYECTLDFPIDTSPDEISVPTTVEERETFRGEALAVESEMKDVKRRSATYITLLIVIIILIGFSMWFMITQYPYLRYTTGAKLREKYTGERL